MYGMTSEGTTTDLYTEIFGSAPTSARTCNGGCLGPARSARRFTTGHAGSQGTPTAARAAATTYQTGRPDHRDDRYAATRPPAAQPAPVQVAQQPAPPAPPPEADVPTAYGITANGPTTDLYTAIFGPRRAATANNFVTLGRGAI